jgi:SAM-dependent methyltransferase
MSYYREQLEKWLKRIDVTADSVIDVGGGENPIKTRVNSWNVKEYKILDHDAQFKPDFFTDINYPIGGAVFDKADVIFCLEVFEYIFNPLQAMKNLFELLKDNGIAYISFPTIYPLHNPAGIDYLRYSKNAIEKLLTEAGFATWEITPRIATDGINALRDFYTLEGMHPMKNTPEVFDIGYLVKAYKK